MLSQGKHPKKLNVLSLFDGMSGAQQALERLGVEVTYYASEIDKNAMQITKKNYPKTTFLGSVTELDDEQLLSLDIDLLVGGSPCQGFSMAGHKQGMVTEEGVEITSLEQYLKLKNEGFSFSGESYLFWEYIRVLRLLEPKYFLLENVKVQKEWEQIFNRTVGVKPVLINSSLVSAQNRQRFYWSNFDIPQPPDLGIVLKDILEDDIALPIGECQLKKDSSNSAECNQVAIATDIKGHGHISRIYSQDAKGPTLNTMQGGNRHPKVLIEDHWDLKFKKSYVQYDIHGKGHQSQDQRACYLDGKHSTLVCAGDKNKVLIEENKKYYYRKLSPLECERLQTVSDDYTLGVSNSQRYKMLGNGFTIDVIKWILSGMDNITDNDELDDW